MRLPSLRYSITILIVTLSGTFHFGYSIATNNGASSVIRDFMNSSCYEHYNLWITQIQLDWIWSLYISLMFIGAVMGRLIGNKRNTEHLGAPISSKCTNKLGERRALLVNAVFGVIGPCIIIIAYVTNVFELMFIGRLVYGITIGYGFSIQVMKLI
jgi:MFS family permease